MTAEARIPTDSTGWRAIDIFVFTNGQQNSPPRKYHLNAQELNWWNAILSFLAKSQYGSQHSVIDLYTVSGEKLEGPLQLSNGAAYVAVKPPDIFLDTGYSKYLVKATRSWEKSQARKSNSNEITNPDELNITTIAPNIETSANKGIEEIQVNNTISPDSKVVDRPHTLLNIHEYPQRDCSAINKQLDKKRVSPIQRSSILRKTVTTPSSIRKDLGKNKDVSKNSKCPLKVNEEIPKENGGIIAKPKIHSKPDKPTSAIKPGQKGLKETEAPQISNHSNANIIVVDKANYEYSREKDDSLLVSNIFKSTDSEIPSIVVPLSVSQNTQEIDNMLINITEELNCNEEKDPTDIFNNVVKTDALENPQTLSHLKNILSNEIVKLPQMQKAPNVSFAEKSDQNYYVINNGDIVNLKLQIEVRSSGGAVNIKSSKEQKNYTSPNIVKTEKGSQIDLDSDMVQNKSLQSIFMSEWIENADKKSGVIIIKCTCCQEKDYSLSKINTETLLKDNKMYVIILPTPNHDNNLERCQCENKIFDIVKTDSKQTHRSSIINPVKKTTSTMALEILKSLAEVSKSTTQDLHNSSNNACVSKVAECPTTESETKPHIAIVEKDIINQKRIEKSVSKTYNVDYADCGLIVDSTKMLAAGKDTSDKATQTELCSLLLEARRNEDGLYSFHLPPLHILKYYRL